MPDGFAGFVTEDVDLMVLRVFGSNYDTDTTGQLMLVEKKFRSAWLNKAQEYTFGLMHRLLRAGDQGQRYRGFYVLQYSAEDWDRSQFRVNGQLITRDEFHRFLALEDIGIPSLFD